MYVRAIIEFRLYFFVAYIEYLLFKLEDKQSKN
jgi:hypothetical protein